MITLRNRLALVPAALLVGALTTLAATQPAAAATLSQSSASAIEISALSTPLIPISSAVDTGATPTVTSSFSGAIPLLPGENLVNTGVYSQTAIATDGAVSSACAGIVGSGATLSLGADGTCTPSTTSGPAIINLPGVTLAGTGFTFRIEASALYSVCTAGPSDGTSGFTAQSTLANVNIIAATSVFGIPGPAITIPINLNQPLSIPAPFNQVLSVDLNATDTTGPQTSATALHIGLGPNSSLLSLDLGHVVCGANASALATPIVNPYVAGGTLAVTGAVAALVMVRLRRRESELV